MIMCQVKFCVAPPHQLKRRFVMSAVRNAADALADDGVDVVKFLMVAGENPILAVGHPFTRQRESDAP